MVSKTKKQNIKLLIIAGILIGIFGAALTTNSSVSASDCNGTKTYFDWGNCSQDVDGDKKPDTILSLLINIFNWLAIGVTIAVIGGIIYGGFMYATSAGDTSKTKNAVGIIRNAIIALILYFAMWSVLNWLIPGGLFN